MTTTITMQSAERELMNLKLDSMTEYKILKHWRTYEPKLIEQLLDKQMLRKALTRRADDLYDLQKVLERTERLEPTLARLEAWNRLMKSSTDIEAEAVKVEMGAY